MSNHPTFWPDGFWASGFWPAGFWEEADEGVPRSACVDIEGKPRLATTATGKTRLNVTIEGHLCR